MDFACAQIEIDLIQGFNAGELNLNASHFQNVVFRQEYPSLYECRAEANGRPPCERAAIKQPFFRFNL